MPYQLVTTYFHLILKIGGPAKDAATRFSQYSIDTTNTSGLDVFCNLGLMYDIIGGPAKDAATRFSQYIIYSYNSLRPEYYALGPIWPGMVVFPVYTIDIANTSSLDVFCNLGLAWPCHQQIFVAGRKRNHTKSP